MKRLLFSLLICSVGYNLNAQYQIGQSISNYSGTNGIVANPSNVADSRFKFHLTLSQTNLHVSNDFVSWNAGFHPFAILGQGVPVAGQLFPLPASAKDSSGKVAFNVGWLNEEINGKPKNAFLQIDQRLFNMMINLGPRTGIGFGVRVRAMGQVTNVTEPLAVMARHGFDSDSVPFQNGSFSLNQLYTNNSFNLNFAVFNEASLTLGHSIIDNKNTLFKVGVTAKTFMPVYAMYIRNSNMNFNVKGKDTFEFSDVNLEYGYVSDDFVNNINSPYILGSGLGFDVGFTYEFRPAYASYKYRMNGKEKLDPGKNKYLIRVQGSVNDMGSVKMNNKQYVRNYRLAPNSTIVFDPATIDTLMALNDRYGQENGTLAVADSMIGRYLGFASQGNSFEWKLPTILNLNVDFNIYKGFYANVLWIQTLRQQQVNGLRGFSALAVTPRFESRHFELAVPVQITQNYTATRLGLYMRSGPVWIGTDNLNALFAKKDIYGADVYFGVALPIHRKKERDKDGDFVSNRKDKCKKIPGPWANRGCPLDNPDLNAEERLILSENEKK